MNTPMPDLDRAWQLLTQERFAEALQQSAAVLARFPGNVSAHVCHAMANWFFVGFFVVLFAVLWVVVFVVSLVVFFWHNLATLLASAGDVEGAAREFGTALQIKPDDTLAFYGLTQNQKFRDETDLVRAIVALEADPALDKGRREFLNYGLAKGYDDLGVADRAMKYAREANKLGARPYDIAGEGHALDQLKELAGRDAFRRARDSGHPSTAPLFIVGMPRSGTTLVEAILARHPDVVSLGESMLMNELEGVAFQRVANSRPNAGRRHAVMLDLDRDWLRAKAEIWMQHVTGRAKRPFKVVTDKLPENAVRLGLIRRLFPKARVVHVRRHPLDTGVSNFFQRFSSGQGFSTRLDWIGVRTRQVADSMEIWKRALDIPILDISYEKLVADPDTEARRLVAFAGLEWNDACLSPEKATRSVLTASQWQVRQPINTTSVARWTRYEPWLSPMIEAMGGMAWVENEAAEARS